MTSNTTNTTYSTTFAIDETLDEDISRGDSFQQQHPPSTTSPTTCAAVPPSTDLRNLADSVTLAAISGTSSRFFSLGGASKLTKNDPSDESLLAGINALALSQDRTREENGPPPRRRAKKQQQQSKPTSFFASSKDSDDVKSLNLRLRGQIRTIRALEKTVVQLRDELNLMKGVGSR